MSAERPLNKRPAGAEKYDPQALNEDQQRKTNAKKVTNLGSLDQIRTFEE